MIIKENRVKKIFFRKKFKILIGAAFPAQF